MVLIKLTNFPGIGMVSYGLDLDFVGSYLHFRDRLKRVLGTSNVYILTVIWFFHSE